MEAGGVITNQLSENEERKMAAMRSLSLIGRGKSGHVARYFYCMRARNFRDKKRGHNSQEIGINCSPTSLLGKKNSERIFFYNNSRK